MPSAPELPRVPKQLRLVPQADIGGRLQTLGCSLFFVTTTVRKSWTLAIFSVDDQLESIHRNEIQRRAALAAPSAAHLPHGLATVDGQTTKISDHAGELPEFFGRYPRFV